MSEITIQKSDFADDTIALFTGAKQAHMGKYMFSSPHLPSDPVRGAEKFADVFNRCAHYYSPRDEQRLIIQMIPNLSTYNSLIDLGCGTRDSVQNKAIPLLQAINASNYHPVDINHDYLNTACAVIKTHTPQIKANSIAADFFKSDLKQAFNSISNDRALAIMLGGTAMNLTCSPHQGFPKDDFIALMSNCLRALPRDSDMVITYDSCTDAHKIYGSYNTKLQAAFATNLMQRIARDLAPYGTFDANAWRYAPQIVKHDNCIIVAQNLIATKDMTFCIADIQMHITSGQSLTFSSSIKPRAELITDILNRAKITTTNIRAHCNNTATWHSFRKT